MTDKNIQTMAQFADAIGLSRPTVSRYFNDPTSVRNSTQRKIEAGLEQFDYQPNFLASSLMRRKSRAIGVVVPSILDPFYSELVNAIEFYAEEQGYLTVLQCSHHNSEMEKGALLRLQSLNVEGIAMAPLGFTTDMATVERVKRDTPIVFMDSRLSDDLPYIGTDNQQSMGAMVDYLCRSGSPPQLLTMPASALNYNVVEREQAYSQRMQALGHEAETVIHLHNDTVVDDYERYGFDQFSTLSGLDLNRPLTLLCVNDRLAFGVLAAASRLGIKVGTQAGVNLRVAGHDGQRFSAFTSPSLTTVAQDIKKIGVLTCKALLDNDGDLEPLKETVLIRGNLCYRETA